MDRVHHFGVLALLGVCLLSGCNSSASSEDSASGVNRAVQVNTEPIARAAADFLEAVLKGDSQRASARLTPQALKRIADSEMPFSPSGLESATFRIGEIRTPSPDQAVVQCVLTDTSAAEGPDNEEMCCLLRRIESDWRVSGIAYGDAPERPWTLLDFESGQSMPIPRQRATSGPAGVSQPTAEPGGRPSPQRTVQQPMPAVVR